MDTVQPRRPPDPARHDGAAGDAVPAVPGRPRTTLTLAARAILLALVLPVLKAGPGRAAEPACERLDHANAEYIVCTFDLRRTDMRLFLNDADGVPYGSLPGLVAALKDRNLAVPFAMNGGMYHRDRSPVGLYVENGETLKPAANGPGPGNFHMRPNGVFWIAGDRAGVTESRAFTASGRKVDFATQSGPMLVVDGALHPRFIAGSDFRKVRNGVGVRDGHVVVLAISTSRVNFHDFATLFRDRLGCRNALFLDGTISSIHAPRIGRADFLFPVGPIIAVVEPAQ